MKFFYFSFLQFLHALHGSIAFGKTMAFGFACRCFGLASGNWLVFLCFVACLFLTMKDMKFMKFFIFYFLQFLHALHGVIAFNEDGGFLLRV